MAQTRRMGKLQRLIPTEDTVALAALSDQELFSAVAIAAQLFTVLQVFSCPGDVFLTEVVISLKTLG
jgi:hypothetical protein